MDMESSGPYSRIAQARHPGRSAILITLFHVERRVHSYHDVPRETSCMINEALIHFLRIGGVYWRESSQLLIKKAVWEKPQLRLIYLPLWPHRNAELS